MQQADVTSQPLELQFTFYPWWLTGNFTDNAQYGDPTTINFRDLEPLISGVTNQLGALDSVLAQPLGQLFDGAWHSAKPATIQGVIHSIKAQAHKSKVDIKNVVLAAPDSGHVVATVETPADTGSVASLSLAYTLQGWKLTFDAVGPGENWIDTFDATLTLGTWVPELPFGFAPTLTVSGSNAHFGPNSWEASFVAGLDDFFTGLVNAIIDGTFESDFDYIQQAIENSTNETQSLTVQNALTVALNQLNTVGPEIVATGFTQFVMSIDDGDQLVATLTHPLDPGPVLQDATAGRFHLRRLSASDSVVAPGGTLTVVGTDFPLANATQLYVQWPNSASGTTQNELSAELLITPNGGAPQAHTVRLDTSQLPSLGYSYTPIGLTPDTEYTFAARCRDTTAWSLWSNPLTLTTGLSDTVALKLQGQPGSGFGPQQVDTVDLAAGSGDWSTQVTIPASTPPGDYVLAAVQNGQTVASLGLKVGAAWPHINIIDPTNGQVINDPVVPFAAPFTVHGAAFPNNALVTLTIAGQPVGTQVSAINGQFEETLTSPPVQTPSAHLTLTAAGGGASASQTYEQVGVLT